MLTPVAAVRFPFVTSASGVLSAARLRSAFGVRSELGYLIGVFIGTRLLILNAIWTQIHVGCHSAVAALHRPELPVKTQHLISFCMAGAMLIVVFLAILSLKGI